MNRPSRRDSRGSTLVLNLLVMAVFSLMAVIVYNAAKSTVGVAVYNARSAQALAVAEAGLEDAMNSLYNDNSWRAGFNKKAFSGGYYTVTVATPTALSMTLASTGYSSAQLLTGRAVKTVSANVVFISSGGSATAIQSNDLTVSGTVDAYDPRVSLTPTSFVDGGTVWANSVSCGAGGRIYSNVTYLQGNAAPTCVNTPADTVSSTTTAVSLPLHVCNAACQTAAMLENNKINALNPVTTPYSNPGGNNPTLTITQDQVVNITSGTYYFKSVSVSKGILNVDTTNGNATIYYTNSFTMTDNASHPCEVNNLSKMPWRLLIADLTGSHTVTLQCAAVPLYAYLEGSANHFNVNSGQAVYGHFSGGTTNIASGGALHFDESGGLAVTHLSWGSGASGSWAESYKRQ